LSSRRQIWPSRWQLPAAVLYAGKHSLKFYVAHLVIISAIAGAGMLAPGQAWPSIAMMVLAIGGASFGAVWFLGRAPQMLALARRVRAEPVVVEAVEIEDLPSPAA